MQKHFTKCFLAGLVAVLPIGGLVLLVVQLDKALRPLVRGTQLDFPGMAILVAVLGVYLLGLTVTTFVGRWVWSKVDVLLESVPGLAVLYQTLKQILGYGSGKDALFLRVVFIKDEAAGTLELGLVTEETKLEGDKARVVVFLPGSPNPALGRMVLVEPERCLATEIPVDVAIKALLSTGKTGLAKKPGE
ncbi:MAG TPA: DUF502 domain-containing protein [Planctomycetota bacterium]|nr:DUF502 domain-containing protein [Planctomycetota bacterium]